MKLPEQDLMTKTYSTIKKNIMLAISIIFFFFISCKNDIEKIKSFSVEEDLPIQSGKNIEIVYSDSGLLKLRIFAPELRKFVKKNESYYEFPKGIKTIMYTKDLQEKAYIQSEFAIYYESKQLWEAKRNVIAIDKLEKNELYTEILYWDQKAQKVYSTCFTKIITPNGVFYGEEGFEAEENLSKYKLLGKSKGSINVKEDTVQKQDNL